MKFIHTADLHLGRQFHNTSLLEDQAHMLDQLVRLARDRKVDAVVIAGDVYDRALPPADAVKLLNQMLEDLVIGVGVPVIMIAGNHDSADRLGFGSQLLSGQGFHVFGPLDRATEPVVLTDQHGDVYFCPLPFADPAEVRLHFDDPELNSHELAVRALANQMKSRLPDGARSIAIGHCWVTGGSSTESERPLTVGGAGEVAASCFDGFSFTALGHLHRPQSFGGRIHYSGSLLKYSFSEVDHRKSVGLVDIDAKGKVKVERIELTPMRDVRVIEGSIDDLLKSPKAGESKSDYLMVRLTDQKAILDAVGKLRQVYPNVLHLERPGLQIGETANLKGREHLRKTELELFQAFHEEVTGEEILKGGVEAFEALIEELHNQEREPAP